MIFFRSISSNVEILLKDSFFQSFYFIFKCLSCHNIFLRFLCLMAMFFIILVRFLSFPYSAIFSFSLMILCRICKRRFISMILVCIFSKYLTIPSRMDCFLCSQFIRTSFMPDKYLSPLGPIPKYF